MANIVAPKTSAYIWLNWVECCNKDLKISEAHHFVLGYDWQLTDKLRFKAEGYFQYLWNIAGEEGTSYSLINLRRALYLNKKLVNNTQGRNYGIDLTLERFLGDNYYYLITGSVFTSKYKAGDNVWRNTRYNKGFVLNALFGKEFYFANNRKVLDVNARITITGGERYSPILQSQSLAAKRVIFDESRAFSEQLRPPYLRRPYGKLPHQSPQELECILFSNEKRTRCSYLHRP